MKEEYGENLPFSHHGITAYIPACLLDVDSDDSVTVEIKEGFDYSFSFHLWINEAEVELSKPVHITYPLNGAVYDTLYHDGDVTKIDLITDSDTARFDIQQSGTYTLANLSQDEADTAHPLRSAIVPFIFVCIAISAVVICTLKQKGGTWLWSLIKSLFR